MSCGGLPFPIRRQVPPKGVEAHRPVAASERVAAEPVLQARLPGAVVGVAVRIGVQACGQRTGWDNVGLWSVKGPSCIPRRSNGKKNWMISEGGCVPWKSH